MKDTTTTLKANSIANRLVLYTLLISITVSMVITAVQSYIGYNVQMNKIKNSIAEIRTSYVPAFANSVYQVDEEQISILLQSVLTKDNIAYTSVEADSITLKCINTDEYHFIEKYPLVFTPANYKEIPLGTLTVAFTLTDVYRKIITQALLYMMNNLILSIIVAFMIFLLIKRLFLRHLDKIVHFTKRQRDENLDIKLLLDKKNRGDEFDLLADSINIMLSRIALGISESRKKDNLLAQAQKMETVGTLAGGIAHDFNNLLGGIIGGLSLLKFKLEKKDSLDTGTLGKYLNTIEQSAKRASDIVNQLLTLSRKQESVLTPINLNDSLLQIVRIAENSFDKLVTLSVTVYKKPAIINADQTQIEQALLNLAVNASHAMTVMRNESEKKGGKLTITIDRISADRHFKIVHPDAVADDYYQIIISDTGVGMTRDTLDKIFTPFFTTKSKGIGTGLGLSMVYNIIKIHNGFITVYSESGVGTTFNIFLPAAHTTETVPDQSASLQLLRSLHGTILIIDDEFVIRENAKDMLESVGCTVYTAVDGQEGIDVFQRHSGIMDLVILDMNMPNMSGKETFFKLKEINRDVKVLLSSGFREDERIQDILSNHLTGFIQKPYTIEKLIDMVQEVMENNK